MKNKNNMKQSKISFLLTEDELKLLESVTYLEPFLVDVVDGARLKNDKYEVEFLTIDLEDAINALSYTITYVESVEEKEGLLKLYDKIKGYLMIRRGLREPSL